MKRLVSLAFVAFALYLAAFAAVASAQSRTDTFNPEGLVVTEVVLRPLEDGGCAARWCGDALSTDGGVRLSVCTDAVELKAPVNINRCAGLAGAGLNRVGRALRLDLDAGSL